jgi:hypothetical protein
MQDVGTLVYHMLGTIPHTACTQQQPQPCAGYTRMPASPCSRDKTQEAEKGSIRSKQTLCYVCMRQAQLQHCSLLLAGAAPCGQHNCAPDLFAPLPRGLWEGQQPAPAQPSTHALD